MTDFDFINIVVDKLGQAYSSLDNSKWIESPKWIDAKSNFRHDTQHDCLMIYLKGVRWISLLNASIVLLEAGHVHEIGILCRCMDETFEDMLLFIRNLGEDGNPTDVQEIALKEFFQEQFDDPSAPMVSATKRNRVPRAKLRAAIARLPENVVNRHDQAQMQETIYDAFSGYVHGAYPHIMELYGGNPPHYHMAGMHGTPRNWEWLHQLITQTYRGVLGAWYTAMRLGEEQVADGVLLLRNQMEQNYPDLLADPNELLKTMKKKSKNP